MKIAKYKHQLMIILIGALFFMPYIGDVHLFDWDEINFAEAAREMIITGNYLNVMIDFEQFHEKPPLFIWLQVISMKIFGINEFAARFPNSIIGIITLLVLYYLGKKIYDEIFGLFWVLVYLGSLLPHFYFKTAIIDPLFNLLMYLSIYYIFNFYSNNNIKNIIFAAVFSSLAVLTKGPVGILLPLITWITFILILRNKEKYPIKEIFIFLSIGLIPAIIWYLIIFLNSGDAVLTDFISYQIRLLTTGEAGHEGPLYYHFIVLFLGCLPGSVLILRAFRKNQLDNSLQNNFKILNIIILCVVLIVFSLVKTKIVHYSSLAYFSITYLVAYVVYLVSTGKLVWKLSSTILLSIFGLILSLALFWFPIIMYNIDIFLPKIDDEFTREVLKANGGWTGYEWISGAIYFIAIIVTVVLLTLQKYIRAFMVLFSTTALIIFLLLPVLAPRIEAYTQNAPISFYKSLSGQEVYIQPIGFKTYAHYFYSNRKPSNSKISLKMTSEEFENYLLYGNINKQAFFVAKLEKGQELIKNNPELRLIMIKNGFVFLTRYPNGT